MVDSLSSLIYRAKHHGPGWPITIPAERSTINDGHPTRLLGGYESDSSRSLR
jgi:hypothetical protein